MLSILHLFFITLITDFFYNYNLCSHSKNSFSCSFYSMLAQLLKFMFGMILGTVSFLIKIWLVLRF
jgi:hypothetical protein